MTDDMEARQAEAADEYVESLLRGQKPARPKGLSGDDAAGLRIAALLASVESAQAAPRASFVEELRRRFLPEPRRSWLQLPISRRSLGTGLAGGVAALAVCLFGEQALTRLRGQDAVPAGWVPIAKAADLPPGTVKRFIADDVEGHVMNIGGKVWALSAICTHQACVLDWHGDDQEFHCPCHGAQFDTAGHQTGIDEYKTPLPTLAQIPVQRMNDTLYAVTRGW